MDEDDDDDKVGEEEEESLGVMTARIAKEEDEKSRLLYVKNDGSAEGVIFHGRLIHCIRAKEQDLIEEIGLRLEWFKS